MSARRKSLASAGFPYFFAGPLTCPVQRDELISRGCVWFWTKLDQVLDLESGLSQQSDPITVGKMKLNAVVRGPFNAIHAESRPQQSIAGRAVVFGQHTQRQQESMNEEMQSAARS